MRRKNRTYKTTYHNSDGSKTILTEKVRGRHTTVSQTTQNVHERNADSVMGMMVVCGILFVIVIIWFLFLAF